MREIKFRAYSKNRKQMFETEQVYICKGKPCIQTIKGGDFDPEEVELMQYTGLKDKNGKEIYEGDIVKAPKAQGIVIFDDARFQVDWKINTYKNRSINLLLTKWSCQNTIEIIGNVYSDTHLLNK